MATLMKDFLRRRQVENAQNFLKLAEVSSKGQRGVNQEPLRKRFDSERIVRAQRNFIESLRNKLTMGTNLRKNDENEIQSLRMKKEN